MKQKVQTKKDLCLGLPTQKSNVDIVVVGLSSPLLVGVYQDGKLTETIVKEEKTSDILPQIFKNLLQRYTIKSVYFARGPGSFMAIKLVYIFLKTLQIARNIRLFGCSGFAFNNHQPIKAVGNLYFVEENGKIVTKKIEGEVESSFQLPQNLQDLACSEEETSPLYVIPAVKA